MNKLLRVDFTVQRADDGGEAERDRFRGIISAGVCPHCGDLIARENVVEGWVYSAPCGHRLGRAQADTEEDFGWSEPVDD
jgi:hypothetical protein